MRIPNHVLQFAEANKMTDLVKGFVDLYNNYRAVTFGAKVSYDTSVSLDEKNEKMHNAIKEKVAEIAGVQNVGFSEAVMATNPIYNWAVFAVIGNMIDAILPDTVIDAFGRFADVAVGGFGDTFVWDIKPNDLFAVTKAGNGKRHAFAQRQANGQAYLVPENHMITVEEDLYRILAGKRNLAEYAVKIAQSMETELAYDFYAAIDGTYGSLPTQFKEASFDETSFVTLAQRIGAFNGGAKPVAFGTKLALTRVLPTNIIYNNDLGKEYWTNGYLGMYKGVELFEMPQKANWNSATYAMRLDDTRIYLASTSVNKIGKIAIEGSTITYGNGMTDNATLVQKQTMHKKWACGAITNAFYGICDCA